MSENLLLSDAVRSRVFVSEAAMSMSNERECKANRKPVLEARVFLSSPRDLFLICTNDEAMQFEGAVEQQLDRNSKFKAADAASQRVASFAERKSSKA